MDKMSLLHGVDDQMTSWENEVKLRTSLLVVSANLMAGWMD